MFVNPDIFRAYDIRGVADKDLTEDVVRLIGQSIGSEAIDRNQHSIIVARDGRLSGEKLLHALCEGIQASGCDVIHLGAVPTPLLYFATNVLECTSGVMLTGSHNPPEDNGIKTVIDHVTLAGDDIQKLYQRILNKDLHTGQGSLKHEEILERYIGRVTSDVALKRPLKIVIDCGNGIGGVVAPQLFKRLGCEVIELFCEVDGHFPNHQADPTQPKNVQDLIAAVQEHHADLGLGFDGDADRVGVITNTGRIVWPDRVLMLFAIDVLSRVPGAEIIYDVKCTRYLKSLIEKHGGKPIMWKTGHSFIKAKMRETGAALAGEMSGHMFFKERWYGFDDGIYSGARFLEIVSKQKLSTEDLFHTLPNSVNTPELKVEVKESEKFALMEKFEKEMHFEGAEMNFIDGVRVEFKDGWGLVRASNTTSYLIMRFEANDEKGLKRIQHLFAKEMLRLDPGLQLPFDRG